MHLWRAWIGAVLVALHASAALAAPPTTKVSGWVHAWDDPKTVESAKLVGLGAVALVGVILVLGRVAKRQEAQRKGSRGR